MPEPTLERVALEDLEAEPHARLFGGDEPRTVRLSLDAGDAVAEHTHPGRTIVCHLLEGTLDLSLDGRTHRLVAGEVARFSGDQRIAPTAVESATALLVLAERS